MPEELHDHGFVVTFDSVPENVRDARTSAQQPIKLVFVFKLRELRPEWLKFDGTFIVCLNMTALVDLSKSTTSNFLNQLVLSTDS